MTLSGGEPLLQRELLLTLPREAERHRINTSMETCGLAPWENLRNACRHLDSILFDIKILDPAKHQEQTGAPLEPVLENVTKMMEDFPNRTVRNPEPHHHPRPFPDRAFRSAAHILGVNGFLGATGFNFIHSVIFGL